MENNIPNLNSFWEYSKAKNLAHSMMSNENISEHDLNELAILSVRIQRYEKQYNLPEQKQLF